MKIDFKKGNGLVPVIIQDVKTAQVLMLAYMNEAAYVKTREDNKVCFYSRSKQRLWTKGETSGNYLVPKEILFDCDQDTILIKVQASGPACHLGTKSCFKQNEPIHFLAELEQIINDRTEQPIKSSYTRKLLEQGINKVSQKFGEEAVELIIEAMDQNRENFLNESADMLYHFMVLLKAKEISLQEVVTILQKRNAGK